MKKTPFAGRKWGFLLFKENKNYFNSYQEFLKICPVLEF